MEARPGNQPLGSEQSAAGPTVDGRIDHAPDTPRARRRGVPRTVLGPALGLVLLALTALAYRYWYTTTHFVWTDNAQVSGSIIQVGALNAGEVNAVFTDVGQRVTAGQVVATVLVPAPLAVAPGGTPELGFSNTQNQLVQVRAPRSGVVVARLADPGSTVSAGQPIIALIDPTRLYVTANVNETDVDRIHVGDPVDVSVDSLGLTLPGRVVAITPASAASFSLIPPQNTSGNFTKVVQVVPVKIAVDYGTLPLVVGSSVEVTIHVQ